MKEFQIIFKALNTWHQVCDARNYQNVRMLYDEEHILDELSWPLPSFDDFFVWCLKQPGLHLPHIWLEGEMPIPHIEPFSETESHPQTRAMAPTITVFAHSDKFDKEFNPAHGVDIYTKDNLGISEMRAVTSKFQEFMAKWPDAPLVHLNLLVYSKSTSPSDKFMANFIKKQCDAGQNIVFTSFSMTHDLHWFLLDHKLVLPHHIMTSDEVQNELRDYHIQPTRLPQLQTTDPVANYLALCPGNIVRIHVPLDTTEDVIYRIVVKEKV